jgi:hypothetical protein
VSRLAGSDGTSATATSATVHERCAECIHDAYAYAVAAERAIDPAEAAVLEDLGAAFIELGYLHSGAEDEL